MNWDAIGAVGQAVSALALVFVMVQLRYARTEFARSVRQARADVNLQYFLFRASDESVRRTVKLNSELNGPRELFVDAAVQAGVTEEEALSIWFEHQALWAGRESTFYNIDRLTTGERAAFEAGLRSTYKTQPVGRLWFDSRRSNLNPEFVRYIDDLLTRSG